MTAQTNVPYAAPVAAPARWEERLRRVQAYFAPGDWLALLLTTGLLLLPAYSLEAAGWPLDMSILLPVLLLAAFIGFIIARSQYGELLALVISLLYGGCVVLLIAGLHLGEGFAGVYTAFNRLLLWGVDAFTGGINQDDLVFTVLAAVLFWSIGYSLTWHIFRVGRVFRAVLPPGMVLIVNAASYTGTADLDPYLILFVFFTLLLVVRANLEERQWEWYTHGVRVPRRLRIQAFWIGAALAALLLGGAWLIPQEAFEERIQPIPDWLTSEPVQELSELWNRLFAPPPIEGPTTTDYFGSDSLQLGGSIRLGPDEVFSVSAPPDRRYYWRSRTFDFYDFGRWTSAADTRLTDPEAPLDVLQEQGLQARAPVMQTFTLAMPASRLIYTAPQPLRIDLPTRSDLRYATDTSMVVSVVRPIRVLEQGATYTAVSSMSIATAEQLQAAGTNYPDWVRNTYTAYIPSMTGRTLQLAQQIIAQAGAVTPYDQARAIERWLRTNITYNETIPAPPPGQDPVDWVLFDHREGYCNYYASAMVVMLRSVGVPARMAAGFAQGEWDAERGAFIVRERDAHTWVEVYFPGYGWVEFEPTAAQRPVDRGDEQPAPEQPTALPTVTPSPEPPTATPTPLPTATPTPEPPAAAAQPTTPPTSDPTALAAPPTPTPTPTPSPTPTPVIVPPTPPPTQPRPEGLLALLAPVLVALLIGFVVLLVLALIFGVLYWRYEWRGLRGLSPVAQAYGRLLRYVPLIGVRPHREQTPDEQQSQIVRALPVIEPPVRALTRLYAAERYSDAQPSRHDVVKAEDADRAFTDARSGILKRWLKRRLLFWRRD